MTCRWCGRQRELRDGLCFGCRVRTVGFTFQGGRRRWNQDDMTFTGQAREIEQDARDTGQDIAKVK